MSARRVVYERRISCTAGTRSAGTPRPTGSGPTTYAATKPRMLPSFSSAVSRRLLASRHAIHHSSTSSGARPRGPRASAHDGAMACPHTEDESSVARRIQRRGGRRGDERMARDEIGDAGGEPHALRARGGHAERDPEIHRVARRVSHAYE